MNDQERDLRQGIRELAAEAWRGSGAHPDAGELAAYNAGALAPADEKRVQDHLTACRACAAAALDLARFADPTADDAEDVPAGFGDAVWQGVSAKIRAAEGRAAEPAAPVIPFPPLRERPAAPRRRLLEMLAATIGLSFWVASLRRQVDELARPQTEVQVFQPAPRTVRGAREHQAFVMRAKTRELIVILNPPSPRREVYRVEVVRADGTHVHSASVGPDPVYGSLILTLSRGILGSGNFRLLLYPGAGSGEEPIDEHELRVEPP